jgi:hypothetical protein
VFQTSIIDQLIAAVEAAENRVQWQAAKADLSGEVAAQKYESAPEALLAGVA